MAETVCSAPVYVNNASGIGLRWNIKDLEIRTRSLEKALEPLVIQVTTLVNTKGPSKKKKGRSKRAHVLVAAVEAATTNFIKGGEEIAEENPPIRDEMLAAVDEVKKAGSSMSGAARQFAEDPCASVKRASMAQAARTLLSAVTRLLILADMVDVHLLLNSVHVVEVDIENMKHASSQSQLLDNFHLFDKSTKELLQLAARRQHELKDPRLRDELASARAILKRNSTMLLTASKAYVRHPELAAVKANRDFVLKQMCEAVNTISDVVQDKATAAHQAPGERSGGLASALDDFDGLLSVDPLTYTEVSTRLSLEECLESIMSEAALMADSCTRDDRHHKIVKECDAVRQALQDLLNEYMDNMGCKEPSDDLNKAVDLVGRKTKDLRRQLRKAVVDHVSDSFLETTGPLLALVEAARNGDEEEVEECAKVFSVHANKLVEVANLACTMSTNEDGVKMVRYSATQTQLLYPQVINAATILSARPKSKVTQENMEAFKDAWENQVRILIDSVDDITTIDDFLAVSESHILEDVRMCVRAINDGDPETLDRIAGAISGRSARVCHVVASEMDNYEPCMYTERVSEAVKVLRDQVLPNFAQRVDVTLEALGNTTDKEVDENEFIDASHLVYDGVRDIRMAVLMNKTADEVDMDDDLVDHYNTLDDLTSSSSHTGDISGPAVEASGPTVEASGPAVNVSIDEYPGVRGVTTARDAMRNLSEEDKNKIAAQVENFRLEKVKFDQEVAKWDDTGNDVIALAKYMCRIMMEMTDFTRGRGPLKTTMDVIHAAKKISEAGTKLDKLSKEIADQCPESRTKDDMLAYLDRIALYCHQMNITSKVKADVQNISGELIVSGLDSATSLIQAAKNLMNAVVLTVKCSYVASTKYTRQGTIASPIVVWKMKAPEKKPLVRQEITELKAAVRKGSQKKHVSAFKVLGEFQSPTDAI
ncbi:catenin alpha [Procambarus clarkii]|uniref:catenin alpha n=1 Tax=Procambarus clarkii TaxID=6728 RepID=UPI0037425E87